MNAGIQKGAATRVGAVLLLIASLLFAPLAFAQRQTSDTSSSAAQPKPKTYPKEIRGYKVELAKVEIKKQVGKETGDSNDDEADTDGLIQLGEPRVAGLTPLGITLEVPVTVAAVKQGGRVDFLTFEDMTVNGTPVTVNEYQHSFDLPNDKPKTLSNPISIYVSTPRAVIGVFGEWTQPKDVWPITGRAYVFGRFKKFIFKFKRVVPVELNLSFRNPLG